MSLASNLVFAHLDYVNFSFVFPSHWDYTLILSHNEMQPPQVFYVTIIAEDNMTMHQWFWLWMTDDIWDVLLYAMIDSLPMHV